MIFDRDNTEGFDDYEIAELNRYWEYYCGDLDVRSVPGALAADYIVNTYDMIARYRDMIDRGYDAVGMLDAVLAGMRAQLKELAG